MKITLKDGSVKEYSEAKSIYDIALDISEGLARMACAGEVDGQVMDLRTVIDKDCGLNLLTQKDPEGIRTVRHTCSHVLAEAVKRLFPNAKLAIGPSIDEGFYYDFEAEPFSREDLDKLEKEMKKIIKEGNRLERFTLPRAEAIQLMKDREEPYKVELIEDLPEDAEISFYKQGEGFTDLCAGPHLMSTKPVKAFKLISSSMAYWRGDSNKAQLQRIYGTAFAAKDELNAYLEHLEDIKKRDHNKLGREMKLFTTVDVIGQGLPLLMPRGAKIIQTMQRWIEDLEDNEWGYIRTKTPLMAKSDLYKISGHWDHYIDGMFVLGDEEKDKEVLALRPMTCPFQYYVYKAEQHSYRDLPLRYGETSTLFRNEDSGEMHGLTRVRQFTISEGHLIVRPDQMVEEFKKCIALAKYCLSTLGVEEDVTYHLSKWDPENREKYIGEPEVWEETQQHMREIMDELEINYTEDVGEAAFYGPKIDINAKNVYGKEDTMITIQWDALLAEQFDMYYIDQNGDKVRPYIIHRTSMGCYERTLAWLIEKYAGKFPTWLCPEQVRVLPISDKYEAYAAEVEKELKANGILCTTDNRSEKIGYKIRESRLEKVPYMLVVGQQEEAEQTVSVRSRFAGDEGVKPLSDFISQICKEICTKEIRKEEMTEESKK
ncbi:threonine--tRNA ligase [Petralouisia muris]|uniref:Threonine--tRNA ligase n=1 Tax=Petralouisia muris TaxID=3032872 RepID=A0AC61RXA3_9FIRM|nr:threonine--tRNA ligase [Petralouisia muris]TGY96527.1 threonine--tRNA ligase [Petralouisia muris]